SSCSRSNGQTVHLKRSIHYPKIPGYNERPGRDHWIPLDKLQKDRKRDRTIRICAKTIQMFNTHGGILKKMDPEDSEYLKGLLS
ncbi:MAG: hypothetical protein WCK53_13345, partial [Methanomicrobiales archaeon]